MVSNGLLSTPSTGVRTSGRTRREIAPAAVPARSLVVVTPTFHPEPIGTPLYATDLCRWFSINGWNVHVLTAQPFYPQFKKYEGYGRGTRRGTVEGISVTRVPTIVPRKGRASWRAISELNFLIQGIVRSTGIARPDAVLSISPASPWAVLVGAAIARKAVPHVALVHDIQTGLASATGSNGRILHTLLELSERHSLQVADTVLGLTHNMVGALQGIGVREPIGVLPLWSTVMPPAYFEPLDPEVQYSGNFGEKQAISQLPELAQALHATGIRMRIRGTGPRFDALLPQLKNVTDGHLVAEPLAPSGELTRALSRSPVHVVLQAPGTAPYVMPSKILNALACGATVVAMADEASPVANLAKRLPGLHVVPTSCVDLMAKTIREVIGVAAQPSTRAYIASAAAQAFSREAVLRQLECILCLPPHGADRHLIGDERESEARV